MLNYAEQDSMQGLITFSQIRIQLAKLLYHNDTLPIPYINKMIIYDSWLQILWYLAPEFKNSVLR